MRLGQIVSGCTECGTVFEVDPNTPHSCRPWVPEWNTTNDEPAVS